MTYIVEFPSKKNPGEMVVERFSSRMEAINYAHDLRTISGHNATVKATEA